jgi:hypothetical protein
MEVPVPANDKSKLGLDITQMTTAPKKEEPTTFTQEVNKAKEKAPSEDKGIFFNGKKYGSTDELAAYTSKIEAEKKDLEYKFNQAKQQFQPNAAQKKNHFDAFIENPEGFVSELESNITQKIEQKYTAHETAKETWKKFYQEYPDLRGYEDLVDLSKARVWSEVENLPVDQGLERIAKATRDRLSGIRGKSFDAVKELPSGQAVTMPSESGGASQVAVKVEAKDFITQLRALQKRRG